MKLRTIRKSKAGKTARAFPLRRMTVKIGHAPPRTRLVKLPIPYATPQGSFWLRHEDDEDDAISLAVPRTRHYGIMR